MTATDATRRRFLSYFSNLGLSTTLLPGVLWAQVQQQQGAQQITLEILSNALAISGLSFSEDDRKAMLQGLNQNLARYEEVRNLHIPNNVAPRSTSARSFPA